MKKLTAIILISALLLTACTGGEPTESSDTPSGSTSPLGSESTAPSDSTSSESTQTSSDSESSSEPETPESFTAPDGSTVYFSEANSFLTHDGNIVYPSEISSYEAMSYGEEIGLAYFDFAFARWSEPVFESSLDDPKVLEKTDRTPIENPEYFRVKAGDVLQIGEQSMTVKEAKCLANTHGQIIGQHIILDGELVLDGIIEIGDGEEYLRFFIDSTVNAYPVVYSIEYPDVISPQLYTTEEFQIICDDGQISLPDAGNHDLAFSDIEKYEYIKARITVKGMNIEHYSTKTDLGTTVRELVSVEKIQ
ncbi:MAG: hypothetical protein J1F04_03780 [Oscillospiraceae bacterium]|nr:hypothetical protein [Oscillospiraceae bacterium]